MKGRGREREREKERKMERKYVEVSGVCKFESAFVFVCECLCAFVRETDDTERETRERKREFDEIFRSPGAREKRKALCIENRILGSLSWYLHTNTAISHPKLAERNSHLPPPKKALMQNHFSFMKATNLIITQIWTYTLLKEGSQFLHVIHPHSPQ